MVMPLRHLPHSNLRVHLSRDFRFACPRWHVYTPESRRAHEILFGAQIVQLQRRSAQPAPTWSTSFQGISQTPLHTSALSSPGGLRCTSGRASVSRHWQRPDPPQHVAEQPPGQMPFCQQEPVVPRMLHQPASSFHQPLLETGERPALDPRRQNQSTPEVTQVVGQHRELEPNLVRPETMARQPRPVRRLLAFLDPLLRRPAFVVEPDERGCLRFPAPSSCSPACGWHSPRRAARASRRSPAGRTPRPPGTPRASPLPAVGQFPAGAGRPSPRLCTLPGRSVAATQSPCSVNRNSGW